MAQSIGYFQFDNLVKGRVGFVFLNFGVETHSVYPHIFKMHLESRQLQLPEGDLKTASMQDILLAMSHHPKETAVIVLCQNGAKSAEVAQALEEAGFINTYFIKGGWDQVLEERA
ncbi:rhodanese-like domain-containing protein [Bdellovibrio sp. HCB337]|uniref:rhodanese-like domain-containing protein n=1 Tax=Bdellovibrio sp. HCB337 TaxID=3394358 RepID=UPI0039A6AD61